MSPIVFHASGFMVPFVYLPNCAKEAGLSKQEGALLLSVLGIANTVGRVFCGWASDKRFVNCHKLQCDGMTHRFGQNE